MNQTEKTSSLTDKTELRGKIWYETKLYIIHWKKEKQKTDVHNKISKNMLSNGTTDRNTRRNKRKATTLIGDYDISFSETDQQIFKK